MATPEDIERELKALNDWRKELNDDIAKENDPGRLEQLKSIKEKCLIAIKEFEDALFVARS